MNKKFTQSIISFLKEPNYMVLGTIGKDMVPHLTIVWFFYDGGLLKISITKTRIKYKNLIRDPRVSCLVYDRNNPYRYLQTEGRVVDIKDDREYIFGDFLCERYGRDENYRFDPVRKKEERVTVYIRPDNFFSKGV